MKNKGTRYLVQGAVIAAIYAVVSIFLFPITYGNIQFRVSEALTILPFFTPAAVPGLFIGCIISNIYGVAIGADPLGIIDIVFGSLATLIAAYWTYKIRFKWLVPLPAVIMNAIVIGLEFTIIPTGGFNLTLFLINAGWIGLSEFVICYAAGIPLIYALSGNAGHTLFGSKDKL
jgi:uncharacterized membrane protein